ncbi:hypothetical protein PMAYCL1PPCAC_10636, partial [Pristionchus mayeri]
MSILQREDDIEKASSSLALYYGVSSESLGELSLTKKKKANAQGTNEGIGWAFNPFTTVKDKKMRVIRTAAWLGVMVKLAYVFSGARSLWSYSTFVLHCLGDFSLESATLGSWIVSLIRIPITLVPVFFVDRIGRRPLISCSILVTVISLAILIIAIIIGDSMK